MDIEKLDDVKSVTDKLFSNPVANDKFLKSLNSQRIDARIIKADDVYRCKDCDSIAINTDGLLQCPNCGKSHKMDMVVVEPVHVKGYLNLYIGKPNYQVISWDWDTEEGEVLDEFISYKEAVQCAFDLAKANGIDYEVNCEMPSSVDSTWEPE